MFSLLRIFSIGVLVIGVAGCDASDETSWRHVTGGGSGGGENDDFRVPSWDDPDPPPEEDGEVCDYHTQTPGGWGAECHGDNPGCYRDANFDAAFPDGLRIGHGANYALFERSEDIEAALPTSGSPRALDESVTGTAVGPVPFANSLVNHVVALTLSVEFSELSSFTAQGRVPFRALVMNDHGPCHGMSIQKVLYEANRALGGAKSALDPVAATECAAVINEAFVDGTPCCTDKLKFPEPPSLPQTRLPRAAP